MTKPLAFILPAMILLLLLGGCAPKQEAPHGKIYVLTTFFPLYDFTRQVGGDRITVENLLPRGVGPHEFQLKPEDAKKLQNANLLIINGLGLEEWVKEIVQSNKNLKMIDTSQGVAALAKLRGISLDKETLGKNVSQDPHIWLSPKRAMIQVRNIEKALIEADPQNRSYYEQNAKVYLEKLSELDKTFEQEIKGFHRKEFIAFHKAFHYLAADYGLNQVAVFEEFPGKEPPPQALVLIIKSIKAYNIKALFSEPQFSPRIVERIATDLHIQVYELDTLETGDFDHEHYIPMMLKNLETLKKALD